MKNIQVIIAEDNELYLKGLRTILQETEGVSICGEARDGATLVALANETQADVVLTDIEMPFMNGVEATRLIKENHPHIKVIALTMYNSAHLIVEMLEAGATGYLDKNTRIENLTEAIKWVYEGKYYHCPSTTMRLSRMVASSKALLSKEKVVFTEEEKKIIQYICEEYTNKEIAGFMHLSESAIDKNRKRILDKMGVKNGAGLVVYAMRNQLYGG